MATLGLTFGPTGGHMIPARLVGQTWRSRTDGSVATFSSISHDHPFLQKLESNHHEINYKPWMGSLLGRLRLLSMTARIYPEIRSALEPVDVVLGFGGYPTVPVLLAAWEMGIPIFIQEQNRVMGRANKLFADHAQAIFYGLPPWGNIREGKGAVFGNPVRRMESRAEPWFQSEDPLLVVFGGSQGSRELSRRLDDTADVLLEDGWTIWYVRGEHGEVLAGGSRAEDPSFREVELDPRLPATIAAADVVWARSGAGTISELIHYDTPGLLFPYPHAADDHQQLNARWLADRGPAIIPSDWNREPGHLLDSTTELMESDDTYDVPWNRESSPEARIVEAIEQ